LSACFAQSAPAEPRTFKNIRICGRASQFVENFHFSRRKAAKIQRYEVPSTIVLNQCSDFALAIAIVHRLALAAAMLACVHTALVGAVPPRPLASIFTRNQSASTAASSSTSTSFECRRRRVVVECLYQRQSPAVEQNEGYRVISSGISSRLGQDGSAPG